MLNFSVIILWISDTSNIRSDSFDFGLKQDGMQAEHLFTNPSTSVSEPNQVGTNSKLESYSLII